MMEASRYRQKATTAPAPSKPARAVRMVRAVHSNSESESDFSGLEPDDCHRAIHAITALHRQNPTKDPSSRLRSTDQANFQDHQEHGITINPYTHCGSTKHGDLGCWKRLTCQHCGRKRHPSDNFFSCAGPVARCMIRIYAHWRSSTT